VTNMVGFILTGHSNADEIR